MPKGKAQTSPPTPTDGGSAPPAASKGSPSGAAKPTLDLAKYRREAAAPAATPSAKAERPKIEREQLPLVSWADLGGIDGLFVTDVWAAMSKVTPEKPVS